MEKYSECLFCTFDILHLIWKIKERTQSLRIMWEMNSKVFYNMGKDLDNLTTSIIMTY